MECHLASAKRIWPIRYARSLAHRTVVRMQNALMDCASALLEAVSILIAALAMTWTVQTARSAKWWARKPHASPSATVGRISAAQMELAFAKMDENQMTAQNAKLMKV